MIDYVDLEYHYTSRTMDSYGTDHDRTLKIILFPARYFSKHNAQLGYCDERKRQRDTYKPTTAEYKVCLYAADT